LSCLEELDKQADRVRIEAIVVGDVESLTHCFKRLRLIKIPCAQAHSNVRRNIGIAHAQAPLIGFLDDDAYPLPGWASVALQLNPDINQIWTGPEYPAERGRRSALIFSVCRNPLLDSTSAHVNGRRSPVSWWEVPFCNLVVPRRVFNGAGMLATDIPWDMDYFHFCYHARSDVTFHNNPEMAICHDRYPDSFSRFFAYRWKSRVRTGEKLISHPYLYGRIFPVIACALVPWVLLATLLLLPSPVSTGVVVFGICVLFLLSQARLAYRAGGVGTIVPYLALLAALQGISVVGMQVGILRRSFQWIRRIKV